MSLRNKKNSRHTPLAGDFLQCVLQRGAVLNMVELQQEVFVLAAELLVKQRLGCFAGWTGGLAEEGDVVRVDDALCLCLRGEYGGGKRGYGGCQEAAEDGSYGCDVY